MSQSASAPQAPQSRAPWKEEFQAGRMGDEVEAALRLATAAWLLKTWAEACGDDEWFAPGCGWVREEGRVDGTGGDPTTLRGPERYAHVVGVWRRLDRSCDGLFWPVHDAVISNAEMRELAPLGTPTKERAKLGRDCQEFRVGDGG